MKNTPLTKDRLIKAIEKRKATEESKPLEPKTEFPHCFLCGKLCYSVFCQECFKPKDKPPYDITVDGVSSV